MLLISFAYLIPSIAGIVLLAVARHRVWTVPVWSFLVAPWCVVPIGFINFVSLRADAMSRPGRGGGGFPIQGPMSGLGGLVTFVAGTFWLIVLTGCLVTLWKLKPQKQCWTPKATYGAWMAAALSIAWGVMLWQIDDKTLPTTPYDTFVVVVPDKFLGRAWIFEDKTVGVPPKWVLGRAHYTIPRSGVLITRDAGPLERHARDLKSIWVTVRTASGDIIPYAPYSSPRKLEEPLYYAWQRHTKNKGASTGYHELFIGTAAAVQEFRLPPETAEWLRGSYDERLLWSANAKILCCPINSTVNGDPVEWRHVKGGEGRHSYEAMWTQAGTPEGASLRIQLTVNRNMRDQRSGVEMKVENVGEVSVDGWEVTYDAPYEFVPDGSFTYYRSLKSVDAHPAFIPLVPQPFARHIFFREPDGRSMKPGGSDAVRRERILSIDWSDPTLEWAKTLSPVLAN